ncbi:MAG TPA: acetyl-CoA decarbonylase/synthase complex subunit delta [Desulfotomaculum sp.]|nr:MAG: acetyl-CoA decarbonylase/synthase complex subunit delta [Peptococcaceae bacterium BRH_c8a]KJS75362.1 MAG: acetyl-CoA decarbonylase/synthase complex subunit delta [Desulfotomaculum sp. BICA1-6]HBX24028.1 acetyl-CoA decarbonylase/synthase complex subunit delta [Desulfotomaculum sp.]
MAVTIAKEKWTSKVGEMELGTGAKAIKVGGETSLPFLHFEGEIPNRPVMALEVWDMEPTEWPDILKKPFDGVLADPVAWAKKNVEYGADLIAIRFMSAHPDFKDASPEECAATAKAVADAVDVPLVLIGCGIEEKDAAVMEKVGEALSGKQCLIGCATEKNYKTITAAAMVNGHSVIASSPLDINLAKQLNILMTEMNLPTNRIAIDPLVGALGYGIEYAYSIMERARMGALMGDKMLAMPVICFVGQEAWKAKEAKSPDEETPEWGALDKRAILWEVVTTTSFALAGGSIFILRHPETIKHVNAHFAKVMESNAY